MGLITRLHAPFSPAIIFHPANRSQISGTYSLCFCYSSYSEVWEDSFCWTPGNNDHWSVCWKIFTICSVWIDDLA